MWNKTLLEWVVQMAASNRLSKGARCYTNTVLKTGILFEFRSIVIKRKLANWIYLLTCLCDCLLLLTWGKKKYILVKFCWNSQLWSRHACIPKSSQCTRNDTFTLRRQFRIKDNTNLDVHVSIHFLKLFTIYYLFNHLLICKMAGKLRRYTRHYYSTMVTSPVTYQN